MKLDLNHIYIYKTKIYILRNKVSCKDQLKPHIYIDFLVDYDLYNIYYIWFFSFKRVMCTKDIIFIKNKFYKLDKLNLKLMKDIKKIMKYFKILLSRPVFKQEKSDFDKEKLSYIYNQLYIITGQD